MKNNRGITVITLVITIIVIVLIASITIYSGLDTVESVRVKEAKDTTNAIYMALVANENIIPSDIIDGKMISDCDDTSGETLDDKDFELLGLDYTTENCKVVFSKSLSGENLIVYNFTYTNELNKTYNDLIYTAYRELPKINTEVDFDNTKGVNRPIIYNERMIAISYNGENVSNPFSENWYNYERNASRLATITCNGETFVWIPRFAYKIQDFYLGKNYKNVPGTAIDIVFLRENSNYMANNEVLQANYFVHPAFASGEAGFWVSTASLGEVNSISNAISEAEGFDAGYSYLMRNSEYAAAVMLSKYLNNSQIVFSDKEYVGAVCDGSYENFDIYSSSLDDINYIDMLQGHAMKDTPWDLAVEPVMPDGSLNYMVRNVDVGGVFYYSASNGTEMAFYRAVLKN